MNTFSEHPNWSDLDHAIERLEPFLNRRAESDNSIKQGLIDEPTLLVRKPFVIADTVNIRLSEFVESDVLNHLHKRKDSGAAVVMVPDDETSILISLSEGIRVLFPIEPDNRFEPALPFSWVPALKRSIAESHVEKDLRRYLLIDQFHLIFSASAKDQRIFGRVLQQLCALDTVSVIVGVNETAVEETALVLGFIEEEETISVPLPRHHVRPTLEVVKLNTASYRKKRTIAKAGVALAGCITGAGLMAMYQNRPLLNQDMVVATTSPQRAIVMPINPQGVVLDGADFQLPKSLPAKIDEMAGKTSDIGPDPEVTEPEESTDVSHVEELVRLSPEAETPKSDMLYFVAESYCFGNGVEKDLERGLNYLNQSYNFGNEKAANLLATCYSKGLGVERNLDRAFQLYEEAVNRGSTYAFGNLGVHYLRGWGCEADADKASAMFSRGAEAGDPVAALYLAKCLEVGIGNNGSPDLETARKWYVNAAKYDHPDAIKWCQENGVDFKP